MPRADCTASEASYPPRISNWRAAGFYGDGNFTRRRKLGFPEMVRAGLTCSLRLSETSTDTAVGFQLRERAHVVYSVGKKKIFDLRCTSFNQETAIANLKSDPLGRRRKRSTGPSGQAGL